MKKRNHPLYILWQMLNNLKQVIFPLILAMVAYVRSDNVLITIFAVVGTLIIVVVYPLLKWNSFVYYLENETLLVENGVLFKSKQAIAFDKITTVNINQHLFEKIFGLATLKVDAGAATQGNEIKLTITREEAEAISRQLSVGSKSNRSVEPDGEALPPHELYQTSFKELLKYAVTNANFLLGIILLSGFWQFLKEIPFIKDWLNGIVSVVESGFHQMEGQHLSLGTWVSVGVSLLVLYLLFSFIASIITTTLKYHGFTVARQTNELKISYGLLDKKTYNLSPDKITALYIAFSPIGNLFGLAELKIENIGYGDEKGEAAILFPIMQEQRINEFLKAVLPEFQMEANNWTKADQKSKLGYSVRYAIVPLIGAIVLSFIFKYGYIAFTVPVFMAFLGRKAHKKAGIWLSEDKSSFASGVLGRKLVIVQNQFFQGYSVAQNPLQKRNQLINIEYAYQSNSLGRTVGIKGVKETVALGLEQFVK